MTLQPWTWDLSGTFSKYSNGTSLMFICGGFDEVWINHWDWNHTLADYKGDNVQMK